MLRIKEREGEQREALGCSALRTLALTVIEINFTSSFMIFMPLPLLLIVLTIAANRMLNRSMRVGMFVLFQTLGEIYLGFHHEVWAHLWDFLYPVKEILFLVC